MLVEVKATNGNAKSANTVLKNKDQYGVNRCIKLSANNVETVVLYGRIESIRSQIGVDVKQAGMAEVRSMKTREKVIEYGLSFQDTYRDIT